MNEKNPVSNNIIGKKDISKKKIILIVTSSALLLLCAITIVITSTVMYFVSDNNNTQASIKKNYNTFLELDGQAVKVLNHLDTDPLSGTSIAGEVIKRYSEEGKEEVTKSENLNTELKSSVIKLKKDSVKKYKESLKSYSDKVSVINKVERDNIDMGFAYVKPLKDYADLTTKLKGVGVYLLSDTDRYVKEMAQAVELEGKIIADFEAIDVSGTEFENVHKSFIRMLKVEVQFIESMKNAAIKRSQTDLNKSSEIYKKDYAAATSEYKSYADEVNNKFSGHRSELSKLKSKVTEQYKEVASK